MQSSSYISNPVLCVNNGNAILFDVTSSTKNYPVYLKDSLLNTNQEFDYSPFLDLASRVEGGETITNFVYTFTDAGIYVFGDSQNNDKQVGAWRNGEQSTMPGHDSVHPGEDVTKSIADRRISEH